jgi:hypothetical protein
MGIASHCEYKVWCTATDVCINERFVLVHYSTNEKQSISNVTISVTPMIADAPLHIRISPPHPCTAVQEFSGGFKFKGPRKFKPFILPAKPGERLHCKSANIIISGHIRNLVLLDLADLPAGTNDNLRPVPR